MPRYVATNLTATFTGLGSFEVVDIDYGGISIETVEVTHQQSSSMYREFLPGLRDGGEITLTGNFDPDQINMSLEGASGTLTISRTGWTKSLSCQAICTGFGGMSATLGQKISTRITFKITGRPTYS